MCARPHACSLPAYASPCSLSSDASQGEAARERLCSHRVKQRESACALWRALARSLAVSFRLASQCVRRRACVWARERVTRYKHVLWLHVCACGVGSTDRRTTHARLNKRVLRVCVCAPACVDIYIHIYIHTGRGVARMPSWLWHGVSDVYTALLMPASSCPLSQQSLCGR